MTRPTGHPFLVALGEHGPLSARNAAQAIRIGQFGNLEIFVAAPYSHRLTHQFWQPPGFDVSLVTC